MFFRNNNCPKWIIKQVAKQAQDQNIQSNADADPTVANELPSYPKSFTFLLPYTGQKSEDLIIFEKGHASHVTWKCSNQNMLYWY